MTYVIIFLAVWLVLILYWRVFIRWPKEAKEIRESYPGRLILKGFLSPKFIDKKFSDDHLRIFLEFRRRYILFWLSILAVLVALSVLSYYHFKSESDEFMNRMQEKHLSN